MEQKNPPKGKRETIVTINVKKGKEENV